MLEWPRSRRPDCDRCRRSASNGAWCGDRPRAQGVNVDAPGNRTQREAKASQRDTNRRHAGAARRPWGPRKGLREPDGAPREACAEASRAGGTGPWVADEAPAYPSHLAPTPGREKETARANRHEERFSRWSSSRKDPGSSRPRPAAEASASGNAGGGWRTRVPSKACASGPLRDDGRTHDAAEWRNDLRDTEGCDRRGPRRHHHDEPARGAQRHEHAHDGGAARPVRRLLRRSQRGSVPGADGRGRGLLLRRRPQGAQGHDGRRVAPTACDRRADDACAHGLPGADHRRGQRRGLCGAAWSWRWAATSSTRRSRRASR